MEAAYGFSITVAMMMTTILLNYFLLYKIFISRLKFFSLAIYFIYMIVTPNNVFLSVLSIIFF